MGGSTAICSDKTGTLTENRMTVTEGLFGGMHITHAPAADELHPDLRRLLELNFALNSKAFLVEHGADLVEFVGNRTECALLMLGRRWGAAYQDIRNKHQQDIMQVRMEGRGKGVDHNNSPCWPGFVISSSAQTGLFIRRSVPCSPCIPSCIPCSLARLAKMPAQRPVMQCQNKAMPCSGTVF